MELTSEFEVNLPVFDAWMVLTDVQRIAPCMPGAELGEVNGDEYHGRVKVRVGPITAEYKGKATFLELDGENYRAVLRAEGRDTRGQGNASATITAHLSASDGPTRVSVVTDLAISGRVAQLGRGVLADVSNKLMAQFVECLEATLLPPAPEGTGAGDGDNKSPVDGVTVPEPGTGPKEAPAVDASTDGETGLPQSDSIDLVKVAGPPLFKRAAPVLALSVVALFGVWLWRRRRHV
ncbi:MAG TPA: SRPBCC family protein [Acidimicrobiales bacterium]|nr:SRPBCC family protein [Acidimicrobiales bacterium]